MSTSLLRAVYEPNSRASRSTCPVASISEKSLRAYERALQAVAEPTLLGPVLLRSGELNVALGMSKLGIQRLLRGLALTDSDRMVHDPFRKAGMVALAHATNPPDLKRKREVSGLFKQERKRAETWWDPALGYMSFRAGWAVKPRGEDVFSQAAREFSANADLEARVRKLVGGDVLDAALTKERAK